MGKKSRRRNAPSRRGKKKGQKKKGGAEKSSPAVDYGTIDLLTRSRLLDSARPYYGSGMEWTYYDEDLTGSGRGAYTEDGVEVSRQIDAIMKRGEESAQSHPRGSPWALNAALERVWSDPTISNPCGAGLAMGPKHEWMQWAIDTARIPDRIGRFRQECEKDASMHGPTLEKLAREERSGCRDGLDFVLALNCVFQTTLFRLGIADPPHLNLYQALSTRTKEEGICLRVWKGYENRVLEMIKAVQEHPVIPRTEPPPHLGDIRPLKNRGEFPPYSSRRYSSHEEEEEEVFFVDIASSDKEDGFFGGACGFSSEEVNELLMRGVKPWDDGTHDMLDALNGDY